MGGSLPPNEVLRGRLDGVLTERLDALRGIDILEAVPLEVRASVPTDEWRLIWSVAVACAGDDGEGLFEVWNEDVLAALDGLWSLRAQLEDLELRILRTARAAGVSWGEIGKRLGMSRQAVWERWNRFVDHEDKRFALVDFSDGRSHVVRGSGDGRRIAVCGKRDAARSRSWLSDSDVDCAQCYEYLRA